MRTRTWIARVQTWEVHKPEGAFSSSSAFPEQKMDKLSNLTLPDFIHTQNEECTVNFSAVCEALCQIGKKTHLRVKKKQCTTR